MTRSLSAIDGRPMAGRAVLQTKMAISTRLAWIKRVATRVRVRGNGWG